MSESANTSKPGFFSDDIVENDIWGEPNLHKIRSFIMDVVSPSELPVQEDEWGGVSATGAFIINQLIGDQVTTAAELDDAMGRASGKPGDSSLLSVEILKRGLSNEVYEPYSPLKEPADKLAHGKMSLDEYISIYEKVYEKIDKKQMQLFRDYYTDNFIPSFLAVEDRFQEYKATGQMKVHHDSEITAGLLETLVDEGKYIFASQEVVGSVGSQPIAIFRPDVSMPGLVYVPSTKQEDSRLSSTVKPLTRNRYESIKEINDGIGAIALWEKS